MFTTCWESFTNYLLSQSGSFKTFNIRSIPNGYLLVLLYGCELYCIENTDVVKKFYLQCLKGVSRVKNSTPPYMVYGETGCMPIYVDIMSRCLSFYINVKNGPENTLSHTLLQSLFLMYNIVPNTCRYLKYIKSSLDKLGRSYLFNNQTANIHTSEHIKSVIKQRVKDQYIQSWTSSLSSSSKSIFYKTFKEDFTFEPYLDMLPTKFRVQLTKFRLSNHRLPIETGRWNNTDRNRRFCTKCNTNTIGDEFHSIFECDHFKVARNKHIDSFFLLNPSVYKSTYLFKSQNKNTLISLAKFIDIIMRSHNI